MLANQRADERRSARSSVLMKASIECQGIRIPVRVVNLSAHGALVLGDDMPAEDAPVTFRCSGLVTKGWMAWSQSPQGGINFDAPIKPNAALPNNRGGADLIVKDTRKLDFRRPGFRGNQLTEEEREILEEWKREELEKSGKGPVKPAETQPASSGWRAPEPEV
jgi:hypothetical protein